MSTADALRVVTLAAQAEMALVRRDAVAGPLLSQAARAADGMPAGPLLAEAAAMVRGEPGREAVRQAALSLCRMALQDAQADALGAAP
ncbi:MAG: hypothetical protein ACKORG_01800 [Actinomycetota bacterium]